MHRVTGPSMVRAGAADSEVAPQWSAQIAQCRCLELPRAVSGRLAPAAIYFHRPGDWVLRARALEQRARSVLHAGLKPSAELCRRIATDE
jgi:hypothetical protein